MSKWLVDIHGEIEGDFDLICKAESTVPLDKVKKAREEIKKEINTPICGEYIKQGHDWGLREALKILDKLIESEVG